MTPRATVLAVSVASLVWFATPARAQDNVALPEGNGKAVTAAVCSQCHALDALFFYKADDRQWEILVHEMVGFGAQVSPEERDLILRYVTASFSTQPGRAATRVAPLPGGKGREVLESSCGTCHGLSLVAGKRASRAGWETILRRHLSEKRLELSPDRADALLAYLVALSPATTPKR